MPFTKLQKQCLAGGKGVLWCLLVLYGLMLDDAQLRQTDNVSKHKPRACGLRGVIAGGCATLNPQVPQHICMSWLLPGRT